MWLEYSNTLQNFQKYVYRWVFLHYFKKWFFQDCLCHGISNISIERTRLRLILPNCILIWFSNKHSIKIINNINKMFKIIYAQVGAFVSTTRLARIATGARKDTTVMLCRALHSTVNCVRAPTREVAFWSERTRSFVWNVPRDTEVNMHDVTTNAWPQCLVRVFRDFNCHGFLQAPDATYAVTATSETQPGRPDRSAFANRATAIRMSIRTELVTAIGRLAIVWSASTTRVEPSATNVYLVSGFECNTLYCILILYFILCDKHSTGWKI